MTRLVTSGGMIVFAAAMIVGGTGAFFSDTETSTGNVFTAGAVDVEITEITHEADPDLAGFNLNEDGFSFNFTDLKPLDNGTVTYTLSNEENPAHVCAMVDETGNSDNGINDPEGDAGDVTDGNGNGELGNFLSFKFGTQSGALAAISGIWQEVGDVDNNATLPASIEYCFGEYDGSTCVLDEAANYNLAQTDSLTADVTFYAVQTRHNDDFSCADLNDVGNDDLYTGDVLGARLSDKWLFYNDTNDTVMTLNQFAPNGANEIVVGPGSTEAAKMLLHDATGRYNIATFQFKDVKLADIGSMKYRIYDASASAQTPYLHFNVDFNNSDTWQRRLVQVPTGVLANTWTEVDAIGGGATMWTLSGGNWPAGGSEPGTTPGSTAKSWASILADYPNAETRSTDSFFGIRVGHPGPLGEESYVDWVEFDGILHDFSN